MVLLHGRLERHLNDARVLPLESDVSGRWGCGVSWGSKWFLWKWEGQAARWDIAPNVHVGGMGKEVARAKNRLPL